MRIVFLVWAVLLGLSPSWAEARVLSADLVRESQSLLPYCSWLADPDGEQTVETVSSGSLRERFSPLGGDALFRGSGPVWIRLVLNKTTPPASGSTRPGSDSRLVMNLGQLPAGGARVFFSRPPGPVEAEGVWHAEDVFSHENILLPEPGLAPVSVYIRLDEMPGLWFAPSVSPGDAARPALLPADLILPGIFIAAAVACLLRAVAERASWALWAALFAVCCLGQAVLPLPGLGRGLGFAALPPLLAPGLALILLPHVGRCFFRTHQGPRLRDAWLYFVSLLGVALVLLPLLPGLGWMTRLFPLWPLALILLLPICAKSLAEGRPGALAYSGVCVLPVLGAALTLYALFSPSLLHPLTAQAGLWGLALGCVGLSLVKGLPSGGKEREDGERTKAAGLDIGPLTPQGTALTSGGLSSSYNLQAFSGGAGDEEDPDATRGPGEEIPGMDAGADTSGSSAVFVRMPQLNEDEKETKRMVIPNFLQEETFFLEPEKKDRTGNETVPLPGQMPPLMPDGPHVTADGFLDAERRPGVPQSPAPRPASGGEDAGEAEPAAFASASRLRDEEPGRALNSERETPPLRSFPVVPPEDESRREPCPEPGPGTGPETACGRAEILGDGNDGESGKPFHPQRADAALEDRLLPDFAAVAATDETLPVDGPAKIISLVDDDLSQYSSELPPELNGLPEEERMSLSSLTEDGLFLFSLHSLVRDVHDIVEPLAKAKGLIFSWFIAPSLPSLLEGDAPRLRGALSLLLQSAVQSTRRGAVQLAVRKNPGSESFGDLLFTISDNGSTQRTDAGFFHAWELAARSGGSFSVEYSPYNGTQVSFTVSFALPSEQTARGHLSRHPFASAFSQEKGFEDEAGPGEDEFMPVLHSQGLPPVAEDEGGPLLAAMRPEQVLAEHGRKDAVVEEAGGVTGAALPALVVGEMTSSNRRLLANYLNDVPHEHVNAESNARVLEYYQENPVALVIFDADMPEPDIMRGIGKLREQDALRGLATPILVLTSHTAQSARMLEAGASYALCKPYKRQALRDMVALAIPALAPYVLKRDTSIPVEKKASFPEKSAWRLPAASAATPLSPAASAHGSEDVDLLAQALRDVPLPWGEKGAPVPPASGALSGNDVLFRPVRNEMASDSERAVDILDQALRDAPVADGPVREVSLPSLLPPKESVESIDEEKDEKSGAAPLRAAPMLLGLSPEDVRPPVSERGGTPGGDLLDFVLPDPEDTGEAVREDFPTLLPELDLRQEEEAAQRPREEREAETLEAEGADDIVAEEPQTFLPELDLRQTDEAVQRPWEEREAEMLETRSFAESEAEFESAAPIPAPEHPAPPERPQAARRPPQARVTSGPVRIQVVARAKAATPEGREPSAPEKKEQEAAAPSAAGAGPAVEREILVAAVGESPASVPSQPENISQPPASGLSFPDEGGEAPASVPSEAAPAVSMSQGSGEAPLADAPAADGTPQPSLFALPGIEGEAIDPVVLPLLPGLMLSLREALTDAQGGFAQGSSILVQEAAARLAGKAEHFDLLRLGKIARCVERAAQAGDMEAVGTLMEDLVPVTRRYVSALDECFTVFLSADR